MPHHFGRSLAAEKAQQQRADRFYETVLGCTVVARPEAETPSGLALQRKDVDVVLRRADRTILVSEKFRSRDFGDLYLETFSKYPDVPGWIETGEADALAYFYPRKVICASYGPIKRFYQEKLKPCVQDEWYRELHTIYGDDSGRMVRRISPGGRINLIQAFNRVSDGSAWYTLGITIPWRWLTQQGILWREYVLD